MKFNRLNCTVIGIIWILGGAFIPKEVLLTTQHMFVMLACLIITMPYLFEESVGK